MSSLRLEFREPYPVYRALRVPVWEGEGVVSVRRVDDRDRGVFESAIHKLRKLLESVCKVADELGTPEEEKLELAADTIAAFLKAPLNQELSPVAPTPLKAYAIFLLAPKLRQMFLSEDLKEFARRLSQTSREDFEFISELFDPETSEQVFTLWTAFPADTRPGFNTSSLIAHSLMTSALAWCLACGASRRELSTLRLGALLHDIGKAVDPERHWEASEKIARYLLSGLLSEESLSRVASLVREHHTVSGVLSEADRLASASDRLSKIAEAAIGGKLSELRETLGLAQDWASWEFWKRVHESRGELRAKGIFREDPIRELTEEFLKRVPEAAGKVEHKAVPHDKISLVLVDVASIQEYIMRSQELRVVAAASHLIDLVVHAHFLIYLHSRNIRVPPEAFLFSGGGNILMVLPKGIIDQVRRAAEDYSRLNHLRLVVAAVPFMDDYASASSALAKAMFIEKHRVELRAQLEGEAWTKSGAPAPRLCSMCYNAWATTAVDTAEGRKEVCDSCRALYELGTLLHFKPKWGAALRLGGITFTPGEALESGWDDVVSKYILEIIAGHDPDEVRRGIERVRDYAVVKFDGNAIGSFMLESISFTDAIERSFRVDTALKRAYLKALNALYEGVRGASSREEAEKELARVFLGTIYMGGDDGFLIVPSWLAVPFAHLLAEEFSRQIGLKRGLRVGVAAGPARMSVWSLLDCASELMTAGKRALRSREPGGYGQHLSTLAFDVFESGSPSGASASERLSRLSRKLKSGPLDEDIDGLQPYFIRRSDLEGSGIPEFWSKLGKLVLRVNLPSAWKSGESYKVHVEAFRVAYLASRRSESEEVKYVKALRSAILRSWSDVSRSRYWREKLVIYLGRGLAKREEGGSGAASQKPELADAYRQLFELARRSIGDAGVEPIPLADALTLIKLVKGGAW